MTNISHGKMTPEGWITVTCVSVGCAVLWEGMPQRFGRFFLLSIRERKPVSGFPNLGRTTDMRKPLKLYGNGRTPKGSRIFLALSKALVKARRMQQKHFPLYRVAADF